ncbi:MAG: hypothetical protein ACYS8Z_02280 [Planctomycetota bacterium]|jgi:hypothetical protein
MRKNGYGGFALAALLFAGFAVYLFWGRLGGEDRWKLLLPVNLCAGALGCYLLSRRWISSFAGSLIAGAIYGFGPFMLGLGKFHPIAGSLAASIPWLFCPAAFGSRTKWRRNAPLLAVLPFAAIVAFFQIAELCRFFPVHAAAKLGSGDIVGFFAPLVIAEHDIIGTTTFGFYHIPIAGLVMGFAMLLAAKRLPIITLCIVGFVLACWQPVFKVSPVMWLSIPSVCCSVVIGAGVQGLEVAGPSDRKWLLGAACIQGGFAIMALFLATNYFEYFLSLADDYAKLFVRTAEMYVLGTVAVLTLFFLARAKMRLGPLRWAILCLSIAVDIFLGAHFIINRLM